MAGRKAALNKFTTDLGAKLKGSVPALIWYTVFVFSMLLAVLFAMEVDAR